MRLAHLFEVHVRLDGSVHASEELVHRLGLIRRAQLSRAFLWDRHLNTHGSSVLKMNSLVRAMFIVIDAIEQHTSILARTMVICPLMRQSVARPGSRATAAISAFFDGSKHSLNRCSVTASKQSCEKNKLSSQLCFAQLGEQRRYVL